MIKIARKTILATLLFCCFGLRAQDARRSRVGSPGPHALVEDKSLSTYARNVKVIAQDGIVTLKGSGADRTRKDCY